MLALPRWDGPFSSTAYSLAKEMAKRTRVFYIDNPFTWKDVLVGCGTNTIFKRLPALLFGLRAVVTIHQESQNLYAVTPLMVIPINFLPKGAVYNFFSSINSWLLKISIKRILKKYTIKDFIFVNSYNPFYQISLSAIKPKLTVYHCVDNISASKYVNKHGAYLEQDMIASYDLTLVTSRKLHSYASAFSKHVYLLPNAVEFSLFAADQTLLPADFPVSDKKIIGYIGSVDHRIDYELLLNIANQFPHFIILLVGPLSDDYKKSPLPGMTNVITTGAKKIHELPGYLTRIDCAIIPFKCNELTSCIYPLKLNEYLAAAKPVVSTPFSVDLDDFKDVICISMAAGFVESIKNELSATNPEKENERRAVAQKNTWAARVESFWNIVVKYE